MVSLEEKVCNPARVTEGQLLTILKIDADAGLVREDGSLEFPGKRPSSRGNTLEEYEVERTL